MTLLHRAYAFAYSDFRAELAPLLEEALLSDDGAPLSRFIVENRAALTDPYDGEPLDDDWQERLEAGNVQQLGDFALTKYYDGDWDMGLDADWRTVREELRGAGEDERLLLGAQLGPPSRRFDPGQHGSYFQSEEDVQQGLAVVRRLVASRPPLEQLLAPLHDLLEQAARSGKGLYVTF
jgi:hypothetical protein